VNPATTRTVV